MKIPTSGSRDGRGGAAAADETLELKTTDFSRQAVAAALQSGVGLSGFVAYRVAVVVANAVTQQLLGRGLAFRANQALVRGIGALAGPVGWALNGTWTLFAVAGPAYRVTIPSVIQVAFLRLQVKQRSAPRRA